MYPIVLRFALAWHVSCFSLLLLKKVNGDCCHIRTYRYIDLKNYAIRTDTAFLVSMSQSYYNIYIFTSVYPIVTHRYLPSWTSSLPFVMQALGAKKRWAMMQKLADSERFHTTVPWSHNPMVGRLIIGFLKAGGSGVP